MGTGASWTRSESSTFEVVGAEAIAAKAPVTALALGGAQVCGSPAGVAAKVLVKSAPGTLQMGVSKLEGESEWIVDSLGLVGGCPYFANGIGARYCALKAVKDDAIVAALDAAAEEVK